MERLSVDAPDDPESDEPEESELLDELSDSELLGVGARRERFLRCFDGLEGRDLGGELDDERWDRLRGAVLEVLPALWPECDTDFPVLLFRLPDGEGGGGGAGCLSIEKDKGCRRPSVSMPVPGPETKAE